MNDPLNETDSIKELARLLKVLAEPNRLLIIRLLMSGTQCNCRLGDALDLAPNLMSHHLGILRQAGLVTMERDPLDARWVYYSINRAAFRNLKRVLGEFLDPEGVPVEPRPCRPEIAGLALDGDQGCC